jgi:hypothetical protein
VWQAARRRVAQAAVSAVYGTNGGRRNGWRATLFAETAETDDRRTDVQPNCARVAILEEQANHGRSISKYMILIPSARSCCC